MEMLEILKKYVLSNRYTIEILVFKIRDILYDFYGKHRFTDTTKEIH